MKTYDFPDLIRIAKEQNLNFISLVDANENKIVPFNQHSTSIEKQFARIKKRFNSELVNDGNYFVIMGENTRAVINKFLVTKGNAPALQERPQLTQAQEVLTWQNALQMTSDLANLRAEIQWLKVENDFLKKQCAELETEIDVLEAAAPKKESSFLSEATNNAGTFLKENAPMFINLLDKHFSLKERELSLKENLQTPGIKNSFKGSTRKNNMQIGSAQHIAIIKKFHAEGNETELNNHLDLLEQKDKAAHDHLCKELNLNFEDDQTTTGTTEN
jgi:predicted RNase H-like nuclease (RuvC/YqgF family)